MSGRPVWLVSISKRDRDGRIKGTGKWSKAEYRIAETLAHDVLKGVGVPDKERAFRMNVTFCVHRAATLDEIRGLPNDWHCALGGLAGGPVEVLWSNGIPTSPSCRPCENPGRMDSGCGRQDLWIPVDCGECEPCRARAEMASMTPEQERELIESALVA